MPRPVGVRNRDFEEKRLALLDTLTDFALSADLRRPSLRQFAIAAEASEPTLRHYFADRQGLVLAILEHIGDRGKPLWDVIATPSASPAQAMAEYFRVSDAGMRLGGFIRAHAFGMIEGIADEQAGTAYLTYVLEPALRVISDKLRATPHAPRDEKDLRAAALAALSPLLVMSLHQDLLGGAASAPIDGSNVLTNLETWLGKALTD
jgi:AcrR family transcriptional regulator